MKKLIPKKINTEYILLSIILSFALFLRLFKLGKPSLWIDESTSAMAAKMILIKGVPIFDSGLLYGRAYLFHYMQAFFLLFGQTDFLVRLPSVIIGIATILLAYIIGKEYSKTGGILSALFMSVFYLEVFYSRQARFYQLFQFLFFLSIYLLYKSKKNPKFLYVSIISLFITINTQLAGLVLIPFFIIHILIYTKKSKKYLAILPVIPLFRNLLPATKLPSDSTSSAINYATWYASYTYNLIYLVILFFPGLIWSYLKEKRLTLLIIAPSVTLLIGVFSLKTFAFRYAYFAIFPFILYSSLLFSFLYEKYGKIIIIAIIAILILPSNIFFPYTSVNLLTPVDYSLYDFSAPTANYKNIPLSLTEKMKTHQHKLISYFSSDTEWYIRKPDYVLPFSMNGHGNDQISYNKSGERVDRYSGAPILNFIPTHPYYLIADTFSTRKLKPNQRKFLNNLTKKCKIPYNHFDLKIYDCFNIDIAKQ